MRISRRHLTDDASQKLTCRVPDVRSAGVKAMPFWLQSFATPTPGGETPYTLSTADDSLVTSILSAGTFFGALAAFPVGDFRKPPFRFILAFARD